MPTLQELAAQAAQDPNNAWANPTQTPATVLPATSPPVATVVPTTPAQDPNNAWANPTTQTPATVLPATSPPSATVVPTTPAYHSTKTAPVTYGNAADPLDTWATKSGNIDTQRQTALSQSEADIAKRQNNIDYASDMASATLNSANINDTLSQSYIAQTYREAQYAAQQKSIEIERQAAEQRAKEVDPDHWFKQKGVAGTILAAISMGMGAFGAMMPHVGGGEKGGHNFAMDIINGAIDRDVSAQKDNIANGWKDIEFQGKQNHEDFYQKTFTAQKMDEMRATAYSHTINLVNDYKMKASNQTDLAKLDLLKGDLEDKRNDIEQKTADRILKVHQMHQAQAAAAYANSREVKMSKMIDKINENRASKGLAPLTKEQVGNLNIPGSGGEDIDTPQGKIHSIIGSSVARLDRATPGWEAVVGDNWASQRLTPAGAQVSREIAQHNLMINGMLHSIYGAKSGTAMQDQIKTLLWNEGDTSEGMKDKDIKLEEMLSNSAEIKQLMKNKAIADDDDENK